MVSGRDELVLRQRDFDLLNHVLRHRSPAEVESLRRLDLQDRLHVLIGDLSTEEIERFQFRRVTAE